MFSTGEVRRCQGESGREGIAAGELDSRRGFRPGQNWELPSLPWARLTLSFGIGMFSAVDVRTAVKKAKEAAEIYAGATVGLRVEEVARVGETDWNITLSWLVEDTVKKLKENTSPLRSLRTFHDPPPLERIYRAFWIRGDNPVEMKRAIDP